MEKLLVVGSSGLLGSKLVALAPSFGFEVYSTHNTRESNFQNSTKLDVTNRNAVHDLVSEIVPDVIINTAALTNVDYCETHKDEAQRVNVGGVQNLVKASKANDCRFVQISTDSVFDGTRNRYTENDSPNPINQYSTTKLEAEKVVSRLPSYAIARPSVIYGWHSQTRKFLASSTKSMNFAMFVLERLRKNEEISAVTDQFSSPTFADNLAGALLRLARVDESGIFHTAGRSCMSRFQFVVVLSKTFGYSLGLIRPVLSADFKQVALRPKSCCLNVEKAERSLNFRFLTAEEGAAEMRKQIDRTETSGA